MRWSMMRILALLLLMSACAPARAPGASMSCETDSDCESGEKCQCVGVGADPCHEGMSDKDCAAARCGGHACIDPKHPPPPPA
jgi:hypothetical protein